MRQLVAMIAIHAKHLKKHAESAIILRVNYAYPQLRWGLVTLTRLIIWQLIICLPACSKFTVTFVPTMDCTWPGPQSGWSGCATKSPRLKYNICTSYDLSCRPYVPQRREQGNAQVRIKRQPITNIARLAVNFLKIFFGVITPAVRRWWSLHHNRAFHAEYSLAPKWYQSPHHSRQHRQFYGVICT